VSAARGKRVTTIESLARSGRLHPAQDPWIERDVPRCGYCQSGLLELLEALGHAAGVPVDEGRMIASIRRTPRRAMASGVPARAKSRGTT
jgi:aerobic-type carbon monoxide dehydrogenase small subunit (CoxS/CutS family)